MNYKPKLIEVALPLAAINEAAAREKTTGAAAHPQNLHRWWARRPLAAARAVIFASLVDDPSGDDSLTVQEQDARREELFGLIRDLVDGERRDDPIVLARAREEIRRSFPDGPPPVLDPFAGGGAIPFEAHRLGLKALSGDLNPVAVLIQKAMVEIPPRFSGMVPVHPDLQQQVPLSSWVRTQGLAADVEAYGRWMREEAERRIGHLYPDALGPNGERLTPLAWIWARTVESPDPTWNGHVPLVASWTLAKRRGKPTVWVQPVIDRAAQTINYEIREGGVPTQGRTVDRGNGVCLATGAAITGAYLRSEAQAGRLGQVLIAVVAEGAGGRRYLPPSAVREVADIPAPADLPTELVPAPNHDVDRLPMYGMPAWVDAFTPRQLAAVTTFSALLADVHAKVVADAEQAGLSSEETRLRDGGAGAVAYADAIVTYLAFAIDKCTEHWCSICSWHSSNEQLRNAFARQAIPMTWDYCEANPFSRRLASWDSQLNGIVKAIRDCLAPEGSIAGSARQRDARARVAESQGAVVSTDPPYYDNISYADLSDFFYVWLRRNLADIWPDECATLLTPKAQEMIANPYRAGSRRKAEEHFESGMAEFMSNLARSHRPDVPATIFYAYKAVETTNGETRSTGWDTFLQALVGAGFTITSTWPMRTELATKIGMKANMLASSIVLSCRPRADGAPIASRGEFVAALRSELPEAVRKLQSGNIAPVDIPQSTIGPGIGIFSRFSRVVESDGSTMRVSTALGIINDVLGEILDGEESEMDPDSRFALAWYSQYGYNPGASGDADSVARAKNTSVSGVEAAGIGETRQGKFRLYERRELPADWSPTADRRLTVWEATQHLIAALDRSEAEAASLLHQLGGYGERARTLSYLLFKKATDKGWATEAGAYNALIAAWPTLRSTPVTATEPAQTSLLD